MLTVLSLSDLWSCLSGSRAVSERGPRRPLDQPRDHFPESRRLRLSQASINFDLLFQTAASLSRSRVLFTSRLRPCATRPCP